MFLNPMVDLYADFVKGFGKTDVEIFALLLHDI